MPGTITKIRRKKMAEASYTGQIDKITMIAVGSGGVDEDGNVIIPSESDTGLRNELLRREYSEAVIKEGETSYEYSLRLEKDELSGESISELALIDSSNDAVAILCFAPKVKDNDITVYSIVDNY